MESLNTFSGGMNSDLSKTILNKESYLQALNFRGITEVGNSNGSLVNIKGNEHKITLPELKNIYKLRVDTKIIGGAVGGTITITVNGQTTSSLYVTGSTTGFDIYSRLIQLTNCYNSTAVTPITSVFNVAYIDNYVIIFQQPDYLLSGPTPSTLTITITLSNPSTASHTIYFIDSLGVNSLTQTTYISGTNNLIIIGSTFIDEDIYLFSAKNDDTESSPHPNDSFSNLGVIWKLSIDPVTRIHSLKLIYANNLDFTKYYPIAPSAALGRYESNAIQRIYWTDFYNTIKTMLVTDSNLMAVNPALLSVFPSSTFEIPLLKSFLAGTLPQGSYELAYRLKKISGVISNYSQSSNIVNLLGNESDTSSANFVNYEGPSSIGSSGRGIKWIVNNLDNSFDTIEFIILYRSSKTNLPLIYIVPEQNITTANPYEVNITSLTGLDTIELDEFLTLSSGFTHAKTVETKDNILFWGNVKSVKQKSIEEIYDARAFRAKTSGGDDIYLINGGILGSPIPLVSAILTPKTNDNINPYYDSNGDIDTNACYYQPGTTKLGGKGANIEYEFGTESILLSDIAITEGSSGDWYMDCPAGVPYGYKTTGIVTVTSPADLILGSTDSDDQTYPIPSASIGTSKNPYFTSLMKGHQAEEIYRYGIQFFDLQGVPYFTEWIGDIKIPGYGDVNDNPDSAAQAAGITDFRASFLNSSSDQIYGQSIYIKFTVDVTAIAQYISGYQIVRVERTEANKTILGHGMLTNTFVNDGNAVLGGGFFLNVEAFPPASTGKPYNPVPSQPSLETLGQDSSGLNDLSISNRVLTFDNFDFLTGNYSFIAGDKLLVRSKVRPINKYNANNGLGNPRYRTGFAGGLLGEWLTNSATKGSLPSYTAPALSGGKFRTGYDSELSPIYLLFYVDINTYSPSSTNDRVITKGIYVSDGGSVSASDNGIIDFLNYQRTYGSVSGEHPGQGAATMLVTLDSSQEISSFTTYGCSMDNGEKVMALYYRPNINQYGGNTYIARTNNEYIACGSFIPLNRNNTVLLNNRIISFKNYGGDVFINYWDLQKIIKDSTGVEIKMYQWSGAGDPGNPTGLTMSPQVKTNNIFYIPCNNTNNQNVRFGYHADTQMVNDSQDYSNARDGYGYQSYHSNEKNIVRYIPKPFGFVTNDQWRNRIYFSDVKIDNEIQDSWSNYPINQFYDVEGNYGGITSLISLNQNLYYIQERGLGVLMINPISMISDKTGFPIKLGASTSVIQKHFYKGLNIGTQNQWSVYKSQEAISFIDVRNRKIYLFNGDTVLSTSDLKGQRNFINKRLHNTLLNKDNPIISQGILTTFDYQNNEFLYTFKNNASTTDLINDENYTLSYSEFTNSFNSLYSFLPNIYINNNRYLLSTVNDGANTQKLFLHNYGSYGTFYNVLYPSTLKLLINDNPTYTKVFDNITILTEAIDDNVEWNDDLNIYPGAALNPSYPDDVNYKDSTFDSVRCYNQYQNTDWNNLIITPPNNNIRKIEQGFNIQLPRNKFDYDTYNPSTYSIFDSTKLTKQTFGERLRDKWLVLDLKYNNTLGLRFIIHNIKILLRISDR